MYLMEPENPNKVDHYALDNIVMILRTLKNTPNAEEGDFLWALKMIENEVSSTNREL